MADNTLYMALKGFRERFKEDLTDEEIREFRFTSREDLNDALQRLQLEQAKDKRLRNLKRIQGFLEAFDQYGKVLDLFANTSEFVPFVYGPIKFMIQMANNYAESLDTLLDAYKQIGENFPLLKQYEDLIRNNPRMREVLELLYGDILLFHREALRWFRKNGWKRLLQCTWKTFRTTFDGILKNIRSHTALLQSQATVAQLFEFREMREIEQQRWCKLREEEYQKQQSKVVEWLWDRSEYAEQQDKLIETWKPYPGTGAWLFERDEFRQWCDPDICTYPLMWLHGQPGAGKTILASKIVARLQESSSAPVLYFYFTNGDERRNSFRAMAKSLLVQMVKYNSMLLPYLYDKSCTEGMDRIRQTSLCKDLLTTALGSMSDIYIVLDGLDECPRDEEKATIVFFKDFVKSSQGDGIETTRILLIGQNDNISARLLQKEFTLIMGENDNVQDISTYVDAWALEIQKKFSIEEEVYISLAQLVRSYARGMFLYVKLVLDNLHQQSNREKLYREMRPGWFPKGIRQAYERIKVRIFDEHPEDSHSDIWKILGLLVFAKRTLKWFEIQGAFAISTENGNIRFEDRMLVNSAKDLCSSLVEVRSNDCVELVHTTAREYLLSHSEIHPLQNHHELASLCLTVLNSENFNDEATDADLTQSVARGDFAFLDYAIMYWESHVEDFVCGNDKDVTSISTTSLQDLLDEFLAIHYESCDKPRIPESVIDHTKQAITSWHAWSGLEELTAAIASNKWQKHNRNPASVDNQVLDLSRLLGRTRNQLENLSGYNYSIMNQAYGKKIFKCPRMNCDRFSDGYVSSAARNQHQIREHEKPFCCVYSGCDRETAEMGFATFRELQAHLINKHNERPDADSFATRHLVKLSHEEEHVAEEREIIAPLKHQCALCAKAYTRKENLDDHIKMHTGERPEVCGKCGRTFIRRHDRVRHEETHDGKRKFICKGISGEDINDLKPWGCLREFYRDHQLGSHIIFEPESGNPSCIQNLMDQCVQIPGAHNSKKYLCYGEFLDTFEDYEVILGSWGCAKAFTRKQLQTHWKSKAGRTECLKIVFEKVELPPTLASSERDAVEIVKVSKPVNPPAYFEPMPQIWPEPRTSDLPQTLPPFASLFDVPSNDPPEFDLR